MDFNFYVYGIDGLSYTLYNPGPMLVYVIDSVRSRHDNMRVEQDDTNIVQQNFDGRIERFFSSDNETTQHSLNDVRLISAATQIHQNVPPQSILLRALFVAAGV